jgi:hypothetical protein
MEEQERVKVEWNSQLEKILAAEAERCLCYSVLHRLAEQRYSGLNNYIALPCIVLSTLAGTASVGSETLFGGGPLASISIGARCRSTIHFGGHGRTQLESVCIGNVTCTIERERSWISARGSRHWIWSITEIESYSRHQNRKLGFVVDAIRLQVVSG